MRGRGRGIFDSVILAPRGASGGDHGGGGGGSGPFVLDAYAFGGSGWPPNDGTNSASISLTTQYAGDVIVLFVFTGGSWNHSTVGTITDDAGLTWHKKFQDNTTLDRANLEVWWAYSPDKFDGNIEVDAASLTGAIALAAVAISGANKSAPFDTNASNPKIEFTGYGNISASLDTDGPAILLGFHFSTEVPTDGTVNSPYTFQGATDIAEKSGWTFHIALATCQLEDAASGTTLQFGQYGGGFNSRNIIALALAAG